MTLGLNTGGDAAVVVYMAWQWRLRPFSAWVGLNTRRSSIDNRCQRFIGPMRALPSKC